MQGPVLCWEQGETPSLLVVLTGQREDLARAMRPGSAFVSSPRCCWRVETGPCPLAYSHHSAKLPAYSSSSRYMLYGRLIVLEGGHQRCLDAQDWCPPWAHISLMCESLRPVTLPPPWERLSQHLPPAVAPVKYVPGHCWSGGPSHPACLNHQRGPRDMDCRAPQGTPKGPFYFTSQIQYCPSQQLSGTPGSRVDVNNMGLKPRVSNTP